MVSTATGISLLVRVALDRAPAGRTAGERDMIRLSRAGLISEIGASASRDRESRSIADARPFRHGADVAPRQNEAALIEAIGQFWAVSLPIDFVQVAGAYGDASISEYIYLCGSRTLESCAASMGPLLEQSSTVPHLILPTPDGALLWGNILEGDQLFLVPRENGAWTVSAFRRNWHDFIDTDMSFSDWFYLALTGQTGSDWLPD
ncbi:hypothetical protein KGQ19_06985 [Catenulispora sp. NL8]|uniref:Knr4/Smi1-like domain-containing protein n=1 Tax=Catenulispora pinistramenti TaxID=2705254 RepID=A0ABS5KKN8_9ACTN|nr:hypothetical protein [Catenulispora pinistramenti]MBS2546608.1 hypothetical protein [Catenulispora pinistramenti]